MINAAIQRLCERWGCKDPYAALERAVRSTFPDLREVSPPVDLLRLARRRNVLRIDTVKLEADGVISSIDGGYAIEVNRSHTPYRRRFTIAHELGHTFFLELEDSERGQRFRVVDENLKNLRSDLEEDLCNQAAAEILMPTGPFERSLYDFGPSVEGISGLSRLFQVSLWATARRVLDCRHGYPFFCALWQYDPTLDRYVTLWTVRSDKIKAANKLILHKGAPAFKSFHDLSRFRKREWLSLGGALDNYVVDGLVINHEPRRVLTCILFGRSDDWLSRHKLVRADDQLTLLA